MWWKIDLVKLAVRLLPPVLRGGLTVALLKVLTLPLRHLYDQLTERRKNTDRRLLTTANVASMEKALNDAFYLTDGQIRIESTDADERVYWHLRGETQHALYMHQKTGEGMMLKRKGESSYRDSFVVMVPTFLCTSENADEDKYGGKNLREIKNMLSYYKPAGRTYRIELYDYE